MATVIFLTDIDINNNTGAAYSRLMNYAVTLTSQGISIVLTSKINRVKHNTKFKYIEPLIISIGEKCEKPVNKAFQMILKEIDFLRSYDYFKRILKLPLQDNELVYLLYPLSFSTLIIGLFYVKIISRKKVILEKNELNTAIALNLEYHGRLLWIIPYYFVKFFYLVTGFLHDFLSSFFSGIIVISTRLQQLYRKINKRIIRIPILVNSNFLELNRSSTFPPYSIGFSGSFGARKDGLDILLKALSILLANGYNCILNIYGSESKTSFKRIKKLITQNKIEKNVKFYDLVNINEMPLILSKQHLLVLPRPNNLQTQYGFSTKLGEYLASSVPVITTNVSDNGLYIKSGINGIILNKLDEKELAMQIEILLNDTLLSEQIGLNGKETARINFLNNNYASCLKNFLFS